MNRTLRKSAYLIGRILAFVLAILICVPQLPVQVFAQGEQLRTYISDDYIQTKGLITLVTTPPFPEHIEPPATFQVTVENAAGVGLAGIWLAVDYSIVGQVQVKLKSLEFRKPQEQGNETVILCPKGKATYEITFEGPGSVQFFADLTDDWAIGAYSLYNLLRLIPYAGGIIGETPALVFEVADMFPELWEAMTSVGDVLVLGDIEAIKDLGPASIKVAKWFNNTGNRVALVSYLSDKLRLGLSTTEIASISSKIGKVSWICNITRSLMDITQFIMNVALGEVAGWVEIGASRQQLISPNVSVNPSSGSWGTTFGVKWSGFSPNSRLTQHLERRGSSELNTIMVKTDNHGKATNEIDSQVLGAGTYELWGVDNKSGSKSNIVEFTLRGDVDLSAYIVSLSSSSVAPNEGFSVTFTVKNHGNSLSGPFSTWVYTSTSPYGTENLLTKVPIKSIAPDNSQTVTVNVFVPSSLHSGEYYVTAYADAPGSGVVAESNENNNIGSSSPNKIVIKQEQIEESVTLTLYVHENTASGPIIAGAQVTGQDAQGNSFYQITNSSGYVILNGMPGTWSFTASKSGYQTNSWSQAITTETRHAFLIKEAQQQVTLTLYVHENTASGPIIAGAQVTGQDAAGNSFNQTTNSSGYVILNGVPGTWSFTASKSGYQTSSWTKNISSTETENAYLTSGLALPGAFTLSGQSLCEGNSPYNQLSWSSSSGVTSYAVYRNGSLYYNLSTLGTTFKNTEVAAGNTYTYFIRATNASGSTNSNTITITGRSDCAPSLPGAFTLSGQSLCEGNSPYNQLSWSSSSGVTSYAVYRNGSLYYNLSTLGTTFKNTEVAAGNTYTYFIRATNASGSTNSNTITITGRSDCAPSAKFNIGNRVRANTNLNVRTGPGTGYPEITDPDYPGYAMTGTTGTVLSGPVSANGYLWWNIQYDAGYTGWSVEDGLDKI